MGSFDDNIPLTRIIPARPWEQRLPRRNPPRQKPPPAPDPANKPDSEQPDPESGGFHIDEYA